MVRLSSPNAKSQFDDQHDITGLFRFDGYFGFFPDGNAEVDKITPGNRHARFQAFPGF
jgi:hypothetical protein